ncbi:MAG: hypothetical protein RBR70_02850, partial [Arcobacter sp.]|uniref:hypothetical protein n=1 Tax=Arcobacter sp. TaxID=1872629 RepID=UPI002A74D582
LENLAVFLQSIDSDAGDNIVIDESFRTLLSDKSIDLRNIEEGDLKEFIETINGNYIDEDSAMAHVKEMLEKYASVKNFDERVSDTIDNVEFTATLGINPKVGVIYETTSGIIGITDENGLFNYKNGDIIVLKDEQGNIVATFNSNLIGDDNLITLEEIISEKIPEEGKIEQEIEEIQYQSQEKTDNETVDDSKLSDSSIIINEDNEDIDLTSIISNHSINSEMDSLTNDKITIQLDDVTVQDNEMTVNEELEDVIELDNPSDWANTGKEQLDGVNYNVYKGIGTNSTIKLLIEDDIDVNPDI